MSAYQNVYATTPGSAEMPSAGRPFTPELITALIARGVLVAPITLHTGVSSPERHEAPYPEQYEVSRADGARPCRGPGPRRPGDRGRHHRGARAGDRRAPGRDGHAGRRLDRSGDRHRARVRVVDGLITGWHEPQASHLLMLAALAGRPLLDRSYRAALEHGYLWHEFGDSHLILRG